MRLMMPLRYQWERNENDCQTEKVEKKGNVHRLLNMFETKLRKFLHLYFINKSKLRHIIHAKS